MNELTDDEVYTLLLRTGLCVEQLDMESTICFHHEHYYLSNDKFFNGKNDKCVDPFKEHKSQFRGILIKYFFTFLRLIWCLLNWYIGTNVISVAQSQQVAHMLKLVPGTKLCISCKVKVKAQTESCSGSSLCTNPFKIHSSGHLGKF